MCLLARLSADGSTLLSSTYLGGSNYDYPYAVGSDAAGNLYVAGYTNSTNFPVVAATQSSASSSQDAFLAKLDPNGSSLIFSTYLGGNNSEYIQALSVDKVSGDVGVVGYTYSSDFPVTTGSVTPTGNTQAFAAVYSSVGVRRYSTLLSYGTSAGYGAILDSSGAFWVAGYTSDASFPVTATAFQSTKSGYNDGFLSKLKPDGSGMLYSTFFGGSSDDIPYSLANDATGNLYLGGYTYSDNLPFNPSLPRFQAALANSQDGFIAKFDSNGAFQWSTYLGGTGGDYVRKISADPAGNIIAAGFTSSWDYPLLNPLQTSKFGVSAGLVSSDDQGASWTPVPGFTSTFLSNLVVSPADPNLVFARAGCSLWKSTDRGSTFSGVTQSSSTLCNMSALIPHPVNPLILYAAYYTYGSSARTVLARSDDGGATWISVSATLPFYYISNNSNYRDILAISPSAPATAYLTMSYTYDASNTYYNGIYRTTDSGAHWTPVTGVPTGPSWYRVYVNAAVGSTPETVTAMGSNGIYRSTDGGATWNRTTSPPQSNYSAAIVDPTNALVIYMPAWGRLLKSTDGGATWTFGFMPTNSATPNSLTVDRAHPQHLYATYSSNGVYASLDGGQTWSPLNGNSKLRQDGIMDLAVAPASAGSRALVAPSSNQDIFVTKLNPQGSSALWSTYLGVPSYDSLGGVVANASGTYVLTSAATQDLLLTNGAYATPTRASNDLSLIKLTDSGSCTYAVPSTQTLDAYGGDGRFRVTAGSGCDWSVSSWPSWVTVAPTTSGSGLGLVEYSYSRNTTRNPRTGSFVVNGQALAVTQPGLSCGLSLNQSSLVRAADAYTWNNAFYIYASSCSWSVQSDSPWLTVTSNTSGYGNTNVSLAFAVNASLAARSAVITVSADTGDQVTLPVVQSGFGCSAGLASYSESIGASGGTVNVTFVSTPSACAAWSAGASSPWARPATVAGTGSATVAFTVDANQWIEPRKTYLSVGGYGLTLTQAAGSACAPTAALTPLVPLAGSIASSSCYSNLRSSANNYWAKRYTFAGSAGSQIALSVVGQNGFAPYFYLVAPDGSSPGSSTWYNSSIIQRLPYTDYFTLPQTGTYYVEVTSNSATTAGDFKIQLENRCDATPATLAYGFGPAGGTASVPVTSSGGCTWTAMSYNPSLTVTPTTGTGNGSVSFTLPALSSTNTVSTFPMLIAGQWFWITQSNPSGYVTFTPSSISLGGAAQSGLTSGISTSNFTPRSTAPWLTFGNFPSSTTFSYNVLANTSGAARSAQLILGDSSFTVTQAAPAGMTISGTVTKNGSALAGVGVALSGGMTATTTTNATGAYTFAGLIAGYNYTVTPSLYGSTFQPNSASFNNLAANQTANFAATVATYSISGNAGVAGATLALSGSATATTTADAGGAYSFAALAAGGNYTVLPSKSGWVFTPPSQAVSGLAANQTINFTAIVAPAAVVSLYPTALSMGAVSGSSAVTPTQSVRVALGGSSAAWTATPNVAWLTVTSGSGSGDGQFTVDVNPAALPAVGTAVGKVTVSAPSAGLAADLPCTLTVTATGTAPIGTFDTPTDGATVASSIAVTGWTLDDIGVTGVKIWRDPVGIEAPGTLVFIGDAVFVPGARPDVEAAYPSSPLRNRAGWGYMMLTYGLPNSNGVFKIYAIATDADGHQTTLGSKTITVDNVHATKPFGAMATPKQGATVSGAAYVNQGWALTPQPGSIPTDGSTIRVFIDGVLQGTVTYNNLRADVQALFPSYANSAGAGGYRVIDTTALTNGLHTIAWSVRDNLSRVDGVGSRYFTVLNGVTGARPTTQPAQSARAAARVDKTPGRPMVRTGWDTESELRELGPLAVEELERIEIILPAGDWVAYERVAGERRSLPVGSRLDATTGRLTWQLGPGFLGNYELELVSATQSLRIPIQVRPSSGQAGKE